MPRFFEPGPGLAARDDGAGSIPGGRGDVDSDVDRQRPRRPIEVRAVLPESEVDVVRHPRSEKPGSNQGSEVVTDGHRVARFDGGVDVQ
jgi:hypothetical protein